MLVHIEKVLDAARVAEMRGQLDAAQWGDGRDTAGYLSSRVKANAQLPETHPLARKLGATILDALGRNAKFVSAALPLKIVPPLFNRYGEGQTYGSHIDGALRPVAGSPMRVRTDLSATLFFTGPDEYDGGELMVEDTYGAHSVRLPAGDLILYPSTSLHRVTPVTRGARVCSFFWLQSLVRDETQRRLLFELDATIIRLRAQLGDSAEVLGLTGHYHNLLRMWAET